ncbi:hypothetical protein P3T76_001211 [Phytophthora citrophthora]|uniref:Uncharacterized protein n=1 Tax=Phytophthora citrophthora TaxID=4793 RepID=A0AAD9GYZ9_9STRA|nr:hypothetical protein P3T76_001211 [Phytophthora citrophthora]
MEPPPSQRTRVLSGGLPWPEVRGSRLLRALTRQGEEAECQEDALDADFPYELELCIPTAGHLALVLVRKPPGIQLIPPIGRSSTQPTSTSGSAPAAPRVVYVLDALPPSGRRSQQSASQSRKKNAPGVQLPAQQLDELELLQELFAPHTRAAGGKEGSVLIKAPLLCARFDCKVVSIRFIRSGGGLQKSHKTSRGMKDSSSGSTVVGSAAPLRCVVAREDGMAFLWEWQADLCQWVFLNRLCFLENPNLKWTRPVAAFTTTDLPMDSIMSGMRDTGSSGLSSSGATEFAWWSTATKHEPKLKLRRLRFERATNALRATDVVVGSAFHPKPTCDDAVKLLSSKLGLFTISKTQGIFFRSSTASLQTVALSWNKVFCTEEERENPEMPEILMCVHNVTGELVILRRDYGELYIVRPKSSGSPTFPTSEGSINDNGSCNTLVARKLMMLEMWKHPSQDHDDGNPEVLDVAAHRHVFLVLFRNVLHVYALITGDLLETVDLPDEITTPSQQRQNGKCKFWTMSGGAASVGLWAPGGFWTIRLSPAKTVAAALHQPKAKPQGSKSGSDLKDPETAFLAVKDYGSGTMHFDAVRYALEVLERVTPSAMDPTQSHPEAWEAVWHTVSSPALLLALLDNRATSEHVVHELAQHVAAIYKAASGIRSYGRLDGAGDLSKNDSQLLRLTPANLESLHHLSNWVVLAKRKLARLGRSSDDNLNESFTEDYNTRPIRAVSELTSVLANEDDFSAPPTEENHLERKDSMLDPEDARNFRLSRKLRPMSSLRFAASCSTRSERQGQQWLLQLESFLLDGVAFKEQEQSDTARHSTRAGATPSHRLFHSERMLSDFRHVAASSFSKHMYLESMSRLYLLYEPKSLLPFIRCVERFCPRTFSLSGHQPVARSHAERALTLFPPLEFFTNKILQGNVSNDGQAAQASLLAYVDLLGYCGHHAEACRALLLCHLYEESKKRFLKLLNDPQDIQKPGQDEQEEEACVRTTASSSVYFLLLEYCMKCRDAAELKVLLMLKPDHVDMLHVLRALRTTLSSTSCKQQQKGEGSSATGVTVGGLRSVLVALMQQRRIGVAK